MAVRTVAIRASKSTSPSHSTGQQPTLPLLLSVLIYATFVHCKEKYYTRTEERDARRAEKETETIQLSLGK